LLVVSRFRIPRRHLPIPQPDYRIHEMNKRLQQRTDDSDNLWWDAFATEFFEDDATLTLTFCLEDGPKRYSKSHVFLCNIDTVCRRSDGKNLNSSFAQSINCICVPLLSYGVE
jgi:hypothetical protein